MHGAQVYTFTYVCTTFSAEGLITGRRFVIAGDGEIAEVGAEMPAMGAGFGAAAVADDDKTITHVRTSTNRHRFRQPANWN